jgi:hypothetical protein
MVKSLFITNRKPVAFHESFMKYDRFKNKMQNSSYRNKILLFKIPRFTLHETLAANRETFGPNEPEKFHEMRTSVRHFHETFVFIYTVC